MFFAKVTQYNKDVNYLQIELWIQFNSNKNPTKMFLGNGLASSKIYLKSQVPITDKIFLIKKRIKWVTHSVQYQVTV